MYFTPKHDGGDLRQRKGNELIKMEIDEDRMMLDVVSLVLFV